MNIKRKRFGILGILLLSLSGCGRPEAKPESFAEFAVYETDNINIPLQQPEISEDEKLEWDLIPMVRVNGVLYYSTNETRTFQDKFADGQITSSADGSETPVQDDQSNFGKEFDYRYGSDEGELYININDTWERFKSKRLTLEQLLTLSKKGNLTWSDFDGFEYMDIGFGLMVFVYEINPEFCLVIGGTGKDNPMYIRLASAANMENYLDIGTENVQTEEIEQFIQKNKKTEKFVGITAYIKELYGDSMLIHSDSDDFPGTFFVDELDQAAETKELQEGMPIQILMQDASRTDWQSHIALYHAKRITIITEDINSADDRITPAKR